MRRAVPTGRPGILARHRRPDKRAASRRSKGTLYNKASANFRTLIQAWAAYASDAKPQFSRPCKPVAEDDLLRRIEDPALRALIGIIVAERNRLRAGINTLRSHANIVIDRRVLPGEVKTTPDGQVVQVLASTGSCFRSSGKHWRRQSHQRSSNRSSDAKVRMEGSGT